MNNNVDDMIYSSTIHQPRSSVSVVNAASSSFRAPPLPVDPRPPPIPRPTRDSSTPLCDDQQTRSNIPRDRSRHGGRGRGQWSGRQGSRPGSSERNEVGLEHCEPYFVHHHRNGNRRRTMVSHHHQTDVSSHHLRQCQHRSGHNHPSYLRRNNHGYRHNSHTRNENIRPRSNSSRDRYCNHTGTRIDRSCHFEERSPLPNSSHYDHGHHSRTSQAHNRHHHRSDTRMQNNQHHGSSWQESNRGHGRVNGFRTEHLTAHGNNSVHLNRQRRPTLVPFSNFNRTESHFSQSSSVVRSRSSATFMERVAQHAMVMMMQRRSEVRVEEDDSFAVAVDQSSQPHRGASQSEVRRLPTLTVEEWRGRTSGASDADSNDVCVICTEHFSPDATLTVLPCGHAFHRDCVGTWLSIRCTCPMCRRQL